MNKRTSLRFQIINSSTLRSLATGSTVPNGEIKFVKNFRRNEEQILLTPRTLLDILDKETLKQEVKSNLIRLGSQAERDRKKYNKSKVEKMARSVLGIKK